jgi:hypothetical protein
MFMSFHVLKYYIRNHSLFFISFCNLPPTGKRMMVTTLSEHIYLCREVSFVKLVCQTAGGQFFLFCQNYLDAKLV